MRPAGATAVDNPRHGTITCRGEREERAMADTSPRPFLWGAGTSAHQVEGGTTANDWTDWEEAGRLPHADSAATACDHWDRMDEDLGWIETLGLTAYRFSVEWSRIEPAPGRWDDAALDRYAWLAAECRRRGIEPIVTLHHFTSPLWLARTGGFLDRAAAGAFEAFAGRVAARLGRDVRLWITFNEPNVLVSAGYIAGRFPPGERSLPKAMRATANVQAAHRAAYEAIHRRARPASGPVQVGIAIQMLEVSASRPRNLAERALASTLDAFMNDTWPRALRARGGRRWLDFLGVNYYTRARLRLAPLAALRGGETMELQMHGPDEPRSDLAWPIWPDGLARALRRAARHGLPLIVTENGLADAADARRPAFLRDHLAVVADALAAGIDIRGYLHWSLMDNWEWLEGYSARFGLLEVDRATLARRPRASALAYRAIIRRHGRRQPPHRDHLAETASASPD
jgi:beta-glucosidase